MPAGAALEAQHHLRVVVEPAAGHEGGQLGGQRLELEAGHELREVEGMRADIADRAAGPGAGGVGPPVGLLALDRLGQPVLGVFDLHEPYRPERAVGDHRPRLPDHRVAGVVVGQHEERVRLGRGPREVAGLVEGARQRLVADDVDAAGEERLGGRRVHVVRRDDRHRLDAVGAGASASAIASKSS
jgi:hypothetical protein